MSNFYQKLCDAIGAASVREQEPMSAHTTFRLVDQPAIL